MLKKRNMDIRWIFDFVVNLLNCHTKFSNFLKCLFMKWDTNTIEPNLNSKVENFTQVLMHPNFWNSVIWHKTSPNQRYLPKSLEQHKGNKMNWKWKMKWKKCSNKQYNMEKFISIQSIRLPHVAPLDQSYFGNISKDINGSKNMAKISHND